MASIYDQFIGTVGQGVTNPYGLAAVAATGKHESGYSERNAYGQWSDPAESGSPGQAGGILSWRNERLANLRRFASARGDDPNRPSPQTQAEFFLQEDPALVQRLNSAGSIDEAQSLMNNAWRFAGYNRPGGEAARRRSTAANYLSNISNGELSAGPAEYTAPVQGGSYMAGYPSTTGGLGGLGGIPMPQPEKEKPGFFQSGEFGDVLQAVGLSLLSSPRNAPLQNFGTNLLQLEGKREKTTQRNATLEYLKANHPEIVGAVEAGLPIGDAFRIAQASRQQRMDADQRSSRVEYLRGIDPALADAVQSGVIDADDAYKMYVDRNDPTANEVNYGLSPVYGRDADGNLVVGQMGSDCSIARSRTPDGFTPVSPYDMNRDKAAGTAFGKETGAAAAGPPSGIRIANQVSQQVNDLINDPYLPRMIGPIDSRLPNWSPESNRVQARIDQLQGGAFLQAREMLKGGGQITDFEGKKAEAAFVRMNQAQSVEDFQSALREFNDAVVAGAQKLSQAAADPRSGPMPDAPVDAVSSGGGWQDVDGVRIRRAR